MSPKITVITPTRNRANTIHRVFESLNKQTFLNFEWLVCDDASNDNTINKLLNTGVNIKISKITII